MIRYPPGYEPAQPRDPDCVMADLDRRFGCAPEVRTLDPALASPPPDETHMAPTKFIGIQPGRKRAVPGFDGACGRNKAKR